MSTATLPVLAGIPVALASAACFGSSAVLQHGAAHQVPQRPVGRPSLFIDLVRNAHWRASIVLAIGGFALQVVALRLAPLILIQPLLVTGVLWYVLLSSRLYHRRADPLIVTGALLCMAALSAFLLLASPSEHGTGDLDSLATGVPLALGLAATLASCLTLTAVAGQRWRALPLSLAAGVCYGVSAGLVRDLSPHFGEGLPEFGRHWQLYAICLLGPFGVLLNQNSYQAGRLGAPALTIITVTDPLVSIAVGLLWLGESIRVGAGAVVGEALALSVLVGGVALLASRAPVRLAASAGTPPASARSTPGHAAEQPS